MNRLSSAPSRRGRELFVAAVSAALLAGLGLLAGVPAPAAPDSRARTADRTSARAALLPLPQRDELADAAPAGAEPHAAPAPAPGRARLPLDLAALTERLDALADALAPPVLRHSSTLDFGRHRSVRDTASDTSRGWGSSLSDWTPFERTGDSANTETLAGGYGSFAPPARISTEEARPARGSQNLRVPLMEHSGWSLGLRKLHSDDRLGWTTESTSRGSVEQVLAVFTLTVPF